MGLTYQTSYIPKDLFCINLKQTTKILLLFISSFHNGLFMSIDQVVKALGISRSSIFKAKKELEMMGLIKHEIIQYKDALKVNWAQVAILSREQKKGAEYQENSELDFTYDKNTLDTSTYNDYIVNSCEEVKNFDSKVLNLDSGVSKIDYEVSNSDWEVQILDTYIQLDKETIYKFYNFNNCWYCIKYNLNGNILKTFDLQTMDLKLLKRLYDEYLKIRKANADLNKIRNKDNLVNIKSFEQTALLKISFEDLKQSIRNSYKYLTEYELNQIATEMYEFYTKDGRNFRVGNKTLTIKDIAKKAYYWVKKLKINSNDRKVIEKPAIILQPSALPSKPANARYDEDLRQTILKMSSNRPELLLKNKNGVDMLIRAGFDISSLKQSA